MELCGALNIVYKLTSPIKLIEFTFRYQSVSSINEVSLSIKEIIYFCIETSAQIVLTNLVSSGMLCKTQNALDHSNAVYKQCMFKGCFSVLFPKHFESLFFMKLDCHNCKSLQLECFQVTGMHRIQCGSHLSCFSWLGSMK